MSTTDQAAARHLYASEHAPLSTMRYAVSVRTDAAQGLEVTLEKSSRVLLSLTAPSPHGPQGFEVTSVERLPRSGNAATVQVWDASAESAARAEARKMLGERAESYASDARKFSDMAASSLGADSPLTAEDAKRYAAMYRTIADELRKVAASL